MAETPDHILIVDDDPDLLRVFVRWLQAAGYQTTTASNGQAACELVAKTKFQAILSDISMPHMDGIDLLREVRRVDLDVPVILMTASPNVETAAEAVEWGAFRYLLKPIEGALLKETVAKASGAHRLAKLKREAMDVLQLKGEVGDRAGLDVRLDSALKTMWMAYQPIVSWSGKNIFAYEALLRSREPALPHPGAIFDAAERLGRLEIIGRAIRDDVANRLTTDPLSDGPIFVNLHAHDLADETLYSRDALLSKFAPRVVLEITERAALDSIKNLRPRIAELRRLGYRVAVDDLGAGYAGLTSFADLEPDVVKLDMSLIRDVHKERTKRQLIKSMVSLCKEMQIQVVAEGVETAAERDTLIDIGCDLLQGYLFGRPNPTAAKIEW